MKTMRAMKKHWLAAIVCAAAAGPLGAVNAWAGCGTIWTVNPTERWVWITIYDLGKTMQMDYGFVAPHGVRKWTSGVHNLSYACGSFYHVRGEVKASKEPTQPTRDPGNVFDTSVQINPQLRDWVKLVASLVKTGITCVAGGETTCAVKWGVTQGAELAALGAESSGSVVCLKTNDDKNFWWDNSDSCGTPPQPPRAPVIALDPPHRTLGVGTGKIYYFWPSADGHNLQPFEVKAGKWSSSSTKIVQMTSDLGHFRALAPGKVEVHWLFKGKTYSATVTVLLPPH